MDGATPRISEKAVTKATGHGWEHWFAVLQTFDVATNGHAAAAKHLADDHGLDSWWSQSVTVEYELARGLRSANQKTDRTFQVSVQRTVDGGANWVWPALVNLEGWCPRAGGALTEGAEYSGLAGGYGSVRAFVPGKRLRLSYAEGGDPVETLVEFDLTEKNTRTAVRVMHSKLGTQAQAESMRERWTEALEAFVRYYESL